MNDAVAVHLSYWKPYVILYFSALGNTLRMKTSPSRAKFIMGHPTSMRRPCSKFSVILVILIEDPEKLCGFYRIITCPDCWLKMRLRNRILASGGKYPRRIPGHFRLNY
jgi:hypothetical protein